AKNLSASDLASKCGTLYLPSNTGMLGSSSGRYPRGPFALLRDSQATDAGGLDRAGADGVDPDAAARELGGPGPGEVAVRGPRLSPPAGRAHRRPRWPPRRPAVRCAP